MTNIGKDGAIYVSMAGESDKIKQLVFRFVMIERLCEKKAKTSDIAASLERDGIEPTEENINKVKAYFPADRVWED